MIYFKTFPSFLVASRELQQLNGAGHQLETLSWSRCAGPEVGIWLQAQDGSRVMQSETAAQLLVSSGWLALANGELLTDVFHGLVSPKGFNHSGFEALIAIETDQVGQLLAALDGLMPLTPTAGTGSASALVDGGSPGPFEILEIRWFGDKTAGAMAAVKVSGRDEVELSAGIDSVVRPVRSRLGAESVEVLRPVPEAVRWLYGGVEVASTRES